MDFSAVERNAEELKNILRNLKSLCGPEFIDGTNLSWNIINSVIDRDITALNELIDCGKNKESEMSNIKNKIRQGWD